MIRATRVAPNSAEIATAAETTGDATDSPSPGASVGPPVAIGAVVVGVSTPDVKGTSPPGAVEAPVKAGDWVVAVVLGAADGFSGLRTLWRD